jgi:DNA-binding transcriptional LysR family regulator
VLSIRQLRYALPVWREGSFVRAAETLNVSQPAIIGQVRHLEMELGFALFRRTGHGIEVTEIGRTFLMQAEQVHFGTMRLMDLARQLRSGPAGSFAIGISSGVAPIIVPEIMGAIREAKPRFVWSSRPQRPTGSISFSWRSGLTSALRWRPTREPCRATWHASR